MMPEQKKTDLKNLTQDELVDYVESLGQPGFRGRRSWPGFTNPALPTLRR